MSDANGSTPDSAGARRPTVDMSAWAIEGRLNKVWRLTIEEWKRKGIDITKLPMRKDVECVTQLKDQ